MSKIKVLIIANDNYWGSWFAATNIIKYGSPEFQYEKRIGPWPFRYIEGDEKYDIVFIHCACYIHKPETVRQYRSKNRKSKLLAGVRGPHGFKVSKHYVDVYDGVNTNNLWLLKELKKYHNNVHLCHPGVDTSLFKPLWTREGEPFTIGWAGSNWKTPKNYYLVPKLGFKYKTASDNLPLKPQTHDGGRGESRYYPHSEMPMFYNNIDVLVQTSSYDKPGVMTEGCPLPVLEAGACGKPVLAPTTAGAAREYLSDWQIIKGYIREEGFEEMKSKLALLRDDPALRRRLGERNRKVAVEEWDWSIKVKQYEKFFRSIL